MEDRGVSAARSNGHLSTSSAASGTTRVKLALSSSLLHKYSLDEHLRKFWFVIPTRSCLIADFLPLVWASLQLKEDPTVKLFCDGFFIPPHSSASLLRDGDAIDINLWGEGRQAITSCTPGVPASAAPASNCNLAEITNTDRVHAKQPSRNARRKKLKRQMRRQGLLPHAATVNKPGAQVSKHNGRTSVSTQAVVPRTATANLQKQGHLMAQDKQRPRDLTKDINASLHHAAQRPSAEQSSGDDESENSMSTNESSSDNADDESTSGSSDSDASTEGSSDTEESSNTESTAQEEDGLDQKQTKAQDPGTTPPASRCPKFGRFADAASPRDLRVESNKHGKAGGELKGRLPQDTSLPTEAAVGNSQQAHERIPNGSGIPLSKITAIETLPELVNDPLGHFVISERCMSCQIMYKVAEIGPQRLPWVSGWRFGSVQSVTEACITLSPWPEGSEHPLVTEWHRFCGIEDASKARNMSEDEEDRMNMFISSSAIYDPSTGSFVGEVGMDLVSARFIDLSQRDRFQVKHNGAAERGDIGEAANVQVKGTPTVQISSAAEESLKAFLKRTTDAPAASNVPLTPERQHATHEAPATVAPEMTCAAHHTPDQAPVRLPNLPKSAPPHGQAAAVYESQQHFVDVLRQLEARKAELEQQAHNTRSRSPTVMPASAKAANGHSPQVVKEAPRPTAKPKRSPAGASATVQDSKRLRLARGGARQGAIGPVLAMLRQQQDTTSR